MLYCPLQISNHYTALSYTVLYCTVPISNHYTVLYCTVHCCTVLYQYPTTLPYCTVKIKVKKLNVLKIKNVKNCTVLYCTVPVTDHCTTSCNSVTFVQCNSILNRIKHLKSVSIFLQLFWCNGILHKIIFNIKFSIKIKSHYRKNPPFNPPPFMSHPPIWFKDLTCGNWGSFLPISVHSIPFPT